MGSSESKLAAAASETKPELPFKASRVNQLLDPRSPSVGIDRTPIQVSDVGKESVEVKRVCPVALVDPRSPSVGVSRTPAREVMRATVGSFARRLGLLFHSDADTKAPQTPSEEDTKVEELSSTEPLLTPQPSDVLSSLDTHATMLDTPLPPPQSSGSPFVLLEQLEVELQTEPDLSYEEAEEARETPLHKRLSLSLIACHGDATDSSFSEADSQVLNKEDHTYADSQVLNKEDHTYAIPTVDVNHAIESLAPDSAPVSETPAPSGLPEANTETEVVKAPTIPSTVSDKPQKDVPSPQPQRHIRCLTIDAKSPSQVVFKPQWLGKGFGGAGQRVRAQGKGGSSPLALQVAVKKVANENKGQTGKAKSKGNEGRSPLQILKETNSPRAQLSQIKTKVSTPERRRSAHSERRALVVAVDKENR